LVKALNAILCGFRKRQELENLLPAVNDGSEILFHINDPIILIAKYAPDEVTCKRKPDILAIFFRQLRCGNHNYEKMADILTQEEAHGCGLKGTIEWLHAPQSWELNSNGKVIDFDAKKKYEVVSSWQNSGIPAEDIPEYDSFVDMLERSSQPQTTSQMVSGGR
jgi:hypothetical protein